MKTSCRTQNIASGLRKACIAEWGSNGRRCGTPILPKQSIENHKAPAARRKKRPVRNLALESFSPPSGNRCAALRTTTVRRKPIILDEITVATNQEVAALGAVSVLKITHHSRQVAR